MTQSIEKSFLIDPPTTNNAIHCDSLILICQLIHGSPNYTTPFKSTRIVKTAATSITWEAVLCSTFSSICDTSTRRLLNFTQLIIFMNIALIAEKVLNIKDIFRNTRFFFISNAFFSTQPGFKCCLGVA